MADLTTECSQCFDKDLVLSIFDSMYNRVKTILDEEYRLGRINGSDYAKSLTALTSELIKTSASTVVSLSTKETETDRLLKLAQIDSINKQMELTDEQIKMTIRQTEGFDDNLAIKLFESQMNSWALMFSSGLLEDKPQVVSDDEASRLYCSLTNKIGVTCNSDESTQ